MKNNLFFESIVDRILNGISLAIINGISFMFGFRLVQPFNKNDEQESETFFIKRENWPEIGGKRIWPIWPTLVAAVLALAARVIFR